jgi:hypothetical protein
MDSGVVKDDRMQEASEAQKQKADEVLAEIAAHVRQQANGVYNAVLCIDPEHAEYGDPPSLYMHRTRAFDWDIEGIFFKIYFLDYGDVEYENRLQLVEQVLRQRHDVVNFGRETAPDTMMKDMLYAEVLAKA